MGWEQRKRGAGSYYYQSRRVGDRVRKVYRGGGVLGRLAAQLDDLKRLERKEENAREIEEKRRLEQRVLFLRELDEAAEVLIRAELLASGCHQHKGQWRRRKPGA
jgi:TPP-dependent pyruvate/acetoin dehydrogenase alpha subunit